MEIEIGVNLHSAIWWVAVALVLRALFIAAAMASK